MRPGRRGAAGGPASGVASSGGAASAAAGRGGSSETLLLLGFHAVRGRLRAAPETIQTIWADEGRRDARLKSLAQDAEQQRLAIHWTPSLELDRLSAGGRHQGVIARARRLSLAADLDELLESPAAQSPQALVLLLDGVTDPHNLGAILRSADAAGVVGVVAPKNQSAPLNEVAARVSAGGADHVPYLQVTNLARAIERLQDEGFQVGGLDGDASQSIYQTDLTGRLALVLGAEGEGMRRLTREHCDFLVSLPMRGQVESLNVSVACGVACFEALRQRLVAEKA